MVEETNSISSNGEEDPTCATLNWLESLSAKDKAMDYSRAVKFLQDAYNEENSDEILYSCTKVFLVCNFL